MNVLWFLTEEMLVFCENKNMPGNVVDFNQCIFTWYEHANEKRPNDYQLDLQIEAARQHVKSFNFVLEIW